MDISQWRKRIDDVDDQLVKLFNQRARCAAEIGKVKRAEGVPVYQPEREKEILNRIQQANAGPLSNEQLRSLFERIVEETRKIEQSARPEGSTGDKSKQ